MSRRSSYQANRESFDNCDEDAAFLTNAAPQAGHSPRSNQQKSSNTNRHHDEGEYEYGRGHLREQHSSQQATTTTTTTSGRQVSGQRGATITKSTTTTATTAKTSSTVSVDEISVLTSAAIDPLSLPATRPEALSPSSPVPPELPQQLQQHQEPTYSKWSTIIHQLSFLGTGIFSTIAVQWLYYQGAASGSTMLTVFFNYIGMMSVGLVYALQSWYADRKQRRMAATAGGGRTHVEYDVLMTEVNEMTETKHNRVNQGTLQGTINNKLARTRKSLETETHVLGPIDDSDEEDFDEEDGLDGEKYRLRKDRSSDSDEVLTMDTAAANSKTAEQDAKSSARRLHWPVIQVAVMDVIANAMVTVGFFYVGSGMYQVIYSSIVIWCAILTRIFLSRKLNNIQWVAIFGVTIGLAISAVGTVQDASPDGPVQSWIEKSFGALVTLGATFLYSCVYVLSDKVLSTTKPTPIPEKVCSMVGGYASLLTFLYLCIHTFPNWKTEVMDVIADRQGSTVGILLVYPLLVISSMLHSLNYYVLLSRINNIAVGIMQSLRAVLVFVMSHYLFCGVSNTQCFNQWKFMSAIVVIGCVTLFSFNSSPSNAHAKADGAQASSAVAAIKTSASSSRSSSPIPHHRRGQTSESP
ncbi:hypothetical protein EC957_005284 [Mortierella hygrophila]|uniref:Uncharacterized protein n=1 Tax=Mortierella hygrophila TaxID=979708 RepID=A0A9P6K6S6_9FUNG|nr:hypothetical protein EC957_005284 [Mortierella hygrophila]